VFEKVDFINLLL